MFSSSNSPNLFSTASLTTPLIAGVPSFVFVCPSNCGFSSLTDTTATKPSLQSSLFKSSISLSFKNFPSTAYFLIVLNNAYLNPSKWCPPSIVLILLANVNICSE